MTSASPFGTSGATRLRVLVAGSGSHAPLLRRPLEELGHAVVDVAASGAAALDAARDHSAELVLMADASDDGSVRRMRDALAVPVVGIADEVSPGRDPLSYVTKSATPRELAVVLEAAVRLARVDRELAAHDRRLTATLRSMGDGVVTTDADGRITRLNPMAETLTDWSHDEARGRPLQDVVSILDERTRRRLEMPLDAASLPRSLGDELLLVGRAGREVPVTDSIAAIRGDAGECLGYVFIFHEATQKRAADRRVNHLAGIVAYSLDGICGFAADGTVVSWNPAAEKILGYPADEILGRSVFGFAPPGGEADMRAKVARLVETGASLSYEAVRRRQDGRLIDLAVDLFTVRTPAGEPTGYACIFRDLSQLRELQQQFRQAQKMESIGLLASGVAHDFNNLLTVIGGYSQLLLEDLPHHDRAREAVLEIRAAGERAANLTRQLLAFSRKQVLAPVVLDLNAVVAQSVRMFQRLIGADVALRFDPAADLKPVRADLGQIEQVLMNLIVNARDAMPAGGRLTIATANAAGFVRLSVADTGVGIPADVQARVFEPFFTTKAADRGTGLGLAMVYGVVTQSGGHIDLTSEPGAGTTFHIRLPALDTVAAEAADDRAADVSSGPCTETLLVVEDDLSVRQFVGTALRGLGYTVLEAGDGDEALRVAAGHAGPIALLMTDVVMPGMGGQQLADALRRVRPGIKILFVSGYLDDVIARLDDLSTTDPFLHKPFSPLVLAQQVRAVLDAGG